MRFSRFCFVVLVAACSLSGLCAGTSSAGSSINVRSGQKKIYVDGCYVGATKDGIIATKQKDVFLVKSIRSDKKGLFFLKKDRVVLSVKGKRGCECDMCHKVFPTQKALLWHQLAHTANNDSYED